MDFHGMKRQALQSLCKKHGIPANLTNREMADRLALLLKENEKPADNDQPTCSNNLGEIHCKIESNSKIVNQKLSKKVRFSPENETFIFVSSDTESGSDHDNNPKRRLRKRKSVSNLEPKKQVQLGKNVKKAEVLAKPLDNSGRVTRSRVQRVVAGDAEMVFSPLAGNKRGRRRVKNVGVYDKPQPIADLGDKDDPREDAKSRGALIRQRLRSREVVNEDGDKARDGDLAVLKKNSRLRGSKNIRNVKASDGAILLDQIHEDNAIAVEEAKSEQILKRSKRIMAKNKGSSSLSKDLGETGNGRRVTRSRKADKKDSALESEAGSLVVEEESRKVLQLEEPAKGSRRKSVAPQNGKVQSESLACKRAERGQPVKGSRKRSRKMDSEGVSDVEPIVGIVTKDEDLLPNGPPLRSRHSIASFNSAATAVGELRAQDNDGKKKPQRKAHLERDLNIAKPPRRSSRHALKEVGGITDGVRKDLQTKQSKEQILKEESSVTVHAPVTEKPLRRSRPNVSKSNVTELADPKGISAEKNKPSKARMEIIEQEGSFRKNSLSHEEQPVMDIVPECGASKNDSDLCHRKKVKERSNKKRKEGKSVKHSQLGSAEITALNSDENEFTYNTLNSVDQVSESMEPEGAAIFQQMQDPTAEVVDNVKENIVEEAGMENLSLDTKLEGAMEYQSCRSFNTRTESGDENVVEEVSTEPVEYLSKINNVVSCGIISPASGFSPAYEEDSIISPASGFSPAYQEDSNGLKTEESLMGKHVNPVSDKVDDQLADNGNANAQEDKIILELDGNGNYEPDQGETTQENHLSEPSGSRDSERSSEKFSNEAEKIYVLVPYDRNEAEDAVQENRLSEISGSRESERSSEKFSNEAEKICVLVPCERRGIAQVDEYATETADIGEEKVADFQLGIIACDDTAAAPSEPAPQSQDGNQLEALTAMHPEIVARSDAYHVERESCSNNLIELPDETIFREDINFSKLRGQVCSNERTEEIGAMKEKESREYGDGRTPNEIVATVSQVGEFNFGSSEKRGEVLPESSESCLSCREKTANKEENVGKAVDDPKPQVINFDAEIKDNVDGVKEDDVNDHLVEKELQTMYLFPSMHEVGTKEAAEINSCNPAAVEETEAETIEKCGLEGMSKDGEDKEEHVVTKKVTDTKEAENGAPMLPLYSTGDNRAFSKYEIELSKTNDLAQGASDVTLSSVHEDGGTPNEIVATVSQVGEFNLPSSERQGNVLPDLDKSASIHAKSCLSCDGKTANKEENVRKAVNDPKAQVIGFDAETKDNVDGVSKDDVNDRLVEKELQTMYPFTSMHKVGTKEAAEINSCSPAAVEKMEAESIHKCDHEEMSKNGKDREEHAVTNEVTEMEEAENGTPMLPLDSMWDDTALSEFEIELSKTNRPALGASDVTMSSEYEDEGTPNEIVATISQVGEFSFGSSEKQVEVLPDLDKSASTCSESCLSCDGKTANKEENVGKAVDDPKAHVISLDAEIKEYVDGVTEDDVECHLVEKELETMYPFTSMHEVMAKEAVEINSCSLASVDEMEAQRIGKFGPAEMSKNGEDKEELVMADKMEEAENGTPMLPPDSMVDDTAFSKYETELSKTNGLALVASDVTMSSEYEDGGTPNKIVATISQVCEFNFGSSEKQEEVLPDLDKSASIYSESCLSCDGITANKEENVGKAVVDPKPQVVSSDAETKENVEGVTEDDVTDNLVEKELLEQNDNGPDPTLRNSHESCIYPTAEGDDILDRRNGIENVEDGTKLDEQLISPFRLNNWCLSDEKKSAVVKSFSVTPSGRNVPGSSTATFSVQNFSLSCGKEYEFHAYSNRVRNFAEGIEVANEDKGFGHEKVSPPVQGENELGIDPKVEGQNSNEGTNDSTDGFAVENNARTSPQVVAEKLDGYTDVLKLASPMDSDDDLDLNNLFNSNSTNSKRNSKETGEEIDLHGLDNVAISCGQSNEFSDCGNNASTLKPEMNVERSAVSPATASITENKALETAAEMALFTSYELNLFSEERERDEFEEADVRTLKDKLMNKNNEEVNEGREIVSSVENFEKEQHCDHEQKSMVEEVIMLKHTQLVAADDPNFINETNEASEGREIVGSIVSNLELNEGRENVESTGKDCDVERGIVEEFEIGKQNQLSASDEPIHENGSTPKEKAGVPVIKQGLVDCEIHKFESIEFENYTVAPQINASNYAASDTSRTECCTSDSKKPEIHVNSAVEAVASKNPQKLESREDKSPEAKLMERISRSATPKMKTKKDFLIPRTPKSIHKIYDMKENFPSAKREQVNNMTATKTSVKRRPLEDLRKN